MKFKAYRFLIQIYVVDLDIPEPVLFCSVLIPDRYL